VVCCLERGWEDDAWTVVLVNAYASVLVRSLRAASGLSGSWGSYLLVEAAVDSAKQHPEEPRFRRWDGTGRVGVQLQGGLSVDDVLAGIDTRLRGARHDVESPAHGCA